MIETKFKQTEIGLIPEDWKVFNLGYIGELAMCKRIFQSETTSFGEIPFYKIGTFGGCADAYISKEKFEQFKKSYRYPNKGDILISAAGTIGRTVIYDGQPAYYQDSNIVWLAHDERTITNRFLYYYYQVVKWNTENTTIARLYNGNFNKTVIAVPSIIEQQRIASALTSVDNLLSSLDKLIAKKRDIKQGAMQQLLTGKTRLKGFTEPWVKVNVGEEASVGRGRVISQHEISKSVRPQFPVYSSQTSNNGVMGYIDTFDFEGEYVTWTTDGVNAGTVFYRNGRFNCTNVCGTLQFDSQKYSHKFVAMSLGLETSKYVSTNLANPKLMNGVMKSVTFYAPPNVMEQYLIANILSNMESEIAALEAKRKKYESVKQGMMQQLLTGKIRLL
jgi:type I restriction enzyme S subunit